MRSLCILFLFILTSLNICYAQSTNDQVSISLRNFYKSYDSVWVNVDNPVTLKEKLKQLQQNYCSSSLQKRINDYYAIYGLDHDLILDDALPDTSIFMNTLTITKETTSNNSYIVSFSTIDSDPGSTTQRQIYLRLSMINEDNKLKINNIETISAPE